MSGAPGVSVVIPTYRRERVLVEAVQALQSLATVPAEIIIVDQSERHDADTERFLAEAAESGQIRWVRLDQPSIPRAMNRGLLESAHAIVLFLDDDVRPGAALIEAHGRAHDTQHPTIVAGRVIQPWHANGSQPMSGFAGVKAGWVDEFMGGNFSIRREVALQLGGFDERFVRVAYRFEAEFASRVRASGGSIWFEPGAVLHHLKAEGGGTRSYGDYLRTIGPSHSVGEYYYLLRARPGEWFRRLLSRPWRSVVTRHHLRRPWWILPTLLSELAGLGWALVLWVRGPKLIEWHS